MPTITVEPPTPQPKEEEQPKSILKKEVKEAQKEEDPKADIEEKVEKIEVDKPEAEMAQNGGGPTPVRRLGRGYSLEGCEQLIGLLDDAERRVEMLRYA